MRAEGLARFLSSTWLSGKMAGKQERQEFFFEETTELKQQRCFLRSQNDVDQSTTTSAHPE